MEHYVEGGEKTGRSRRTSPVENRDPASVREVCWRQPARNPLQEAVAKTDNVKMLKESVSVGELVQSLNKMGVNPKDLIIILQNIKASGALQGELEIL